MPKIPLSGTIASAYGFAFAGFPSVLGTMWFPFALLFAFYVAVVMVFAPDLPGYVMRGEFDMALLSSFHRVEGLFWLGALVFRSMTTVGLQDRALGRMRGPVFFYFSLSGPVWRMLVATVLAILVLGVIAILTAGATAILAYFSIAFVRGHGHAVAALIVVAAACWFVYVVIRMLFFLPPVVVAERRIGLIRSWELGRGNFWRMFAILLAVLVPVWIGLHAILFAVVGPLLPMDLIARFHGGMAPADVHQLLLEIVRRVLPEVRGMLPFLIAYSLIEQLLYAALGNGAVAGAYLSVTAKGDAS